MNATQANAPEIARTMRLFVAPGQLGEVRIIRRTGGTMGFFFAFDQIGGPIIIWFQRATINLLFVRLGSSALRRAVSALVVRSPR